MAFSAEAEKAAFQHSREEQIILATGERREAVLRVIRSAQSRLILSLFRCDDFKVLDELAEALRRGVQVEVLVTSRARGWKKRLQELLAFLESMGAKVHRYADPVVKYHAKYIVADDGPALVASLNFTRKCFDSTCDFMQITQDPEVVAGLKKLFEADCSAPQSSFPEGLSDRLIVGPQRARAQFGALLEQARRSIRIIDHKLTDPAMLTLLQAKRGEGVAVEVIDKGRLGGLLPHGKMILLDEATATIGSISLSALSLGFRRELALQVSDPDCVSQLNRFFQEIADQRVAEPIDEEALEDEDDEN